MILNIDVNGRPVDVTLIKRKGARNVRLVWKDHQNLRLTAPWSISLKEVNVFLNKARSWMEKKMPEKIETAPFQEGASIPILGREYTLHIDPSASKRITLTGNQLVVRGPENCINLIVSSFLRKELTRFCGEHAGHYAYLLGVNIKQIKIRRMRSRWGSCSSSGNLCFAYHLVFAPADIIQYVCAHEVAHLLEMNHSPNFWNKVKEVYPDYQKARAWLKKEGKSLLRYG